MCRPNRSVTALAIALAASVVAMAAPKFLSVWKAPEARPGMFAGKKVGALLISDDHSLRMSAEEALSRELTSRGAQGVAAYRLVPKEELKDAEKARGWFERNGVEGVVALRPVSAEKERTYTPYIWSQPYYGTLWGYYGYGWGSVYDPGSFREDTIVTVETMIYSVPQNKLLWAAVSQTKNPRELQKFISELAVATVKEFKKHVS
jgi:hypothetical protein